MDKSEKNIHNFIDMVKAKKAKVKKKVKVARGGKTYYRMQEVNVEAGESKPRAKDVDQVVDAMGDMATTAKSLQEKLSDLRMHKDAALMARDKPRVLKQALNKVFKTLDEIPPGTSVDIGGVHLERTGDNQYKAYSSGGNSSRGKRLSVANFVHTEVMGSPKGPHEVKLSTKTRAKAKKFVEDVKDRAKWARKEGMPEKKVKAYEQQKRAKWSREEGMPEKKVKAYEKRSTLKVRADGLGVGDRITFGEYGKTISGRISKVEKKRNAKGKLTQIAVTIGDKVYNLVPHRRIDTFGKSDSPDLVKGGRVCEYGKCSSKATKKLTLDGGKIMHTCDVCSPMVKKKFKVVDNCAYKSEELNMEKSDPTPIIGRKPDLGDFLKAHASATVKGWANKMEREGGAHPFSWCATKVRSLGFSDDPNAFCAAVHLQAYGMTPSQRAKSKKSGE